MTPATNVVPFRDPCSIDIDCIFGVDIGRDCTGNFALGANGGLAVRTPDDKFVVPSIDAFGNLSILDSTCLLLTGVDPCVFRLPVLAVEPGDLIVTSDSPFSALLVVDVGQESIIGIAPGTQQRIEYIPPSNVFGPRFFVRVFSIANLFGGGGGGGLLGGGINPLLLLLCCGGCGSGGVGGGGKDNGLLTALLLSQAGGASFGGQGGGLFAAQGNAGGAANFLPLLALLGRGGGGGDLNPLLLLALSGGLNPGAAGFGNAQAAPNVSAGGGGGGGGGATRGAGGGGRTTARGGARGGRRTSSKAAYRRPPRPTPEAAE